MSVFDRMGRTIAALGLTAALLLSAAPVPALATITPPSISAPSALITTMDGTVLWSRAPMTRRAVASTIKMLNALVVRDSVNMTEVVTVARKASDINNGDVHLLTGQKSTVRQLLEMMLVASANDAAEAVAIHIAGTEKRYVALMNAKARELGLTRTVAVDPHGLSERERSTAADLAVLARTVMADPVLRSIVGKRSVAVVRPHRVTRVYKSTNLLYGHYAGIEGVKTGYTSTAGFCFVGAAKRGGVELLGVVLHTGSLAQRFAQMRTLLSWGFAHCHMRLLVSADTTMGVVTVEGGSPQSVTVHAARETSAALFDEGGPLVTTVTLPATVAGPVVRGQQLGTVDVSRHGVLLATVPLLADSDTATETLALALAPRIVLTWESLRD
jgi:D-alanyl-D-alanine carboxypeptidase (penicillin-binding protein 5/6)